MIYCHHLYSLNFRDFSSPRNGERSPHVISVAAQWLGNADVGCSRIVYPKCNRQRHPPSLPEIIKSKSLGLPLSHPRLNRWDLQGGFTG
ncbi:MAG: hypothetical protein P5681_00835 [Limnospira sp. PMC 894.15]|nr:hypothetical protein [Limnospira sp. PMC 894.15]MDT9232283.1 hypothetical protein [Limnospira sp. PMC 917.15]